MARITRRAALVAVGLGTASLTATARGECCAQLGNELAGSELAGSELAMNNLDAPPHWMDSAIADSIDAKAIAARIGDSRDFVKIVAKALKWVQDNPRKVGNVGPTDTQRVRIQILKELCKSRGQNVDLDS
ncbi:MAG TPA: hypothetical protein VHD36_07375 [Pirellulales bacterium]|nr:hypothetical protein [Pirellulales bacterium]